MLSASVAAGDGNGAATCRIEDDTDVPELSGLTSADDWQAAFIDAAGGRRGRELTTVELDLPSGPAIRADWKKLSATAWVVRDHGRVVVLHCSSKRPPEDRWRSIAESIEFLTAEE